MKTIPYYLFTADRFYSFAERILNVLNSFDTDDADLVKLRELISNKLDRIKQGMYNRTTREFTDDVNEKDDLFDSAFRGLKYFIKAKQLVGDKDVNSAATALLLVIDRHGATLNSLSHSVQNSRAKSLIADFNDPLNMNHIARINAQEWVDIFVNRLDSLENSIVVRNSFVAADAKDNLSELRKEVRGLIDNVMLLVTSKASFSDNKDWEMMLKEIHQVIDNDGHAARLRKSGDLEK
jgi:hypothetical protein